jgi:hypothetical protein
MFCHTLPDRWYRMQRDKHGAVAIRTRHVPETSVLQAVSIGCAPQARASMPVA